MRIAVLTALASVSLVACGQNATSTNNNVAENSTNSVEVTESAATPAPAPATKEEAMKVMHERHEGMEQIGKSTKTIKRQLDSSAPDVAEIQKAATTIADLAAKSPNWFPQGTGPDVGKTGAKAEIWQNQKDFAARLAVFQRAAVAFNAAAASGDMPATKARYADLIGTCNSCHDKYRMDMHH